MRVFVVGMGVISALGLGVEENLQSLLHATDGFLYRSGLLDKELNNLPVGAIPADNAALSQALQVSLPIPRTSLLGLYAANEALQPLNGKTGIRLGFISATTVGGMDQSEQYFRHVVVNDELQQIRHVIHHTCGSATDEIARRLPALDYVSTINTACSSSANSIALGTRKIKQGQLDAVIAGGTDALCRYTLNGFNTLLILDRDVCRPFDDSRAGLNLGEGAGYLLLVSEAVMRRHHLTPVAELAGYANANDAFHATASSDNGEGSFRSMTMAISAAGIAPEDIDYINLHGTGTPNNDLSESVAIKRTFGDNYPTLSSTKSYTGHTLGASGGIEAVFSCLALREQVVFPNLFFQHPMKETGMVPVTQVTAKPLRYVLSNSFGFGGNCSSLIFKNPEQDL